MLVLLFATLGQPRPLEAQSTFLTPASAGVRNIIERLTSSWHLVGLSTTDALALVAIAMVVPAIWAWRRHPRGRMAVFIGVSVVTQIALTGYAIAARTGHVPKVDGQTGGIVQLYGWVDRHSGGKDATFLNNQEHAVDPDAGGWQYVTLLWNNHVTTWAADPTAGVPDPVATVAALPIRAITYDPYTGLAHGLEHAGPFISSIGSPFFQFAGKVIAKGPGNGLELIAPSEPVQAIWRSQGLQLDGEIDGAKPVTFDAWLPPGYDAMRLNLTLQLAGPFSGPTAAEFQFGDQKRTVTLGPGQTKEEEFTACVEGRHLAGSATPTTAATLNDGRHVAGRIAGVTVEPVAGSC
jgi:hypothetical protein